MNNEIIKLLKDNSERAVLAKENRINKERENGTKIETASRKYTQPLLEFIVNILNDALIETKKRYYFGKYHLEEKNNNILLCDSEFCRTTINHTYGWNAYEPFIHIQLDAFVIDDINFLSQDHPGNEETTKKYRDGLKNNIDRKRGFSRSEIKAIARYNKENTSNKIILLPYNWNNPNVEYHVYNVGESDDKNWYACLLNVEELEKYEFRISVENDNTLLISVPIDKLISTIIELPAADESKNENKTLNAFKPLIETYKKIVVRESIREEMKKKCKANIELVSLKIYKSLVENYKNAQDICDDRYINTLVSFVNASELPTDAEDYNLYQDYVMTSTYLEEPDSIIFVRFKEENDKLPNEGKPIPIYKDDLQKIVDELDGKLTIVNNFYKISVNSIDFEDMLIKYSENDKSKQM